MNEVLADVFQQLHLEPGTYRCELPEQEIVVEVRSRQTSHTNHHLEGKSALNSESPVSIDDSCIMLDPWVELPGLSGGIILESRLGKPDLPDVPEISPYDEGEEGML